MTSPNQAPESSGTTLPSHTRPPPPGRQNSTPQLAETISDPAKLLAVYPIGAPFTPSSQVARHLATLTVTSPHPSTVLPDWHTRPEYAEQMSVLQRGPSEGNEVEQSWFDGQRQAVDRMLAGHASQSSYQPAPVPYPYQLPASQMAASLLQTQPLPSWAFENSRPPSGPSSGVPSPSPAPIPRPTYTQDESNAFFEDFIAQALASIPAAPEPGYARSSSRGGDSRSSMVPSSSPLGSSHHSSVGERTPSRPHSASLGARMSAQQPPPPQPNFHPSRPSSSNSHQHAVTSSSAQQYDPNPSPLKRKEMHLPDMPDASSSKRLATPSSPLGAPPHSDGRRSETPTRSRPASQPRSNAIAGPSNEMEIYVDIPVWVPPSSSLTQQASSGVARRASQQSPHPASDLDNFTSPVQSEDEDYEEPDEDYGEDAGGKGKGRQRRGSGSAVRMRGTPTGKPSPRWTGGDTAQRDERDASGKLKELVENILESFDTLPHPVPSDHFDRHPHFSRLSTTSTSERHPLLNATTLKKLTRLLTLVIRKSGGPAGLWWGSSLDEGDPERLMGLLRGSLEEAQAVGDVWGEEVRDEASPPKGKAKVGSKSPEKSAAAKGKGKAKADAPEEVKEEEGDVGEAAEPSVGVEGFEEMMEVALEAALATDCCLVLLSSKGVPAQLYSEEMILLCLKITKQLLSTIVYPYVEALGDYSTVNFPILTDLIATAASKTSVALLRPLADLFQTLILVLPHLEELVGSPAVGMSDDIVIQIVYISIGPFFIADPSVGGRAKAPKGKAADAAIGVLGGKSGLRGLRMAALGLLRTIFGRHENQRAWIVQEVLMSLIKLPDIKKSQKQFQLRDGRAIHIVSALLLQLIQSCTHGVQSEIERRRTKARSQMIIDKQEDGENAIWLADLEKQELHVYSAGLEAATKSAKSIAVFLVQSSASGKASKTSEADYRAVLDMVLSDLVVVVYSPEWPAAVSLMGWFLKLMINSLNDDKTSAEDNASKAIALDHLGLIGARLRSASVQAAARASKRDGADKRVMSSGSTLAEIVSAGDLAGIGRLSSMQTEVLAYLDQLATSDPSMTGLSEYSACMWGQELTAELAKIDTVSNIPVDGKEKISRLALAAGLRRGSEDLWKDRAGGDVFGGGSSDGTRIDLVAEELNCTRALSRAFEPILNAVLSALDSSSVTFRTKALKALGHIITSDAIVLTHANVRRTIENRLNDSSPAVRDAAIDLLGKYVIQQPELVKDYYARISERINDSGLAVRKRVVKLLRTLYLTSSDIPRKVDICVKLFQRSEDEDEGIRDLAIRTIEELWFSDPASAEDGRTDAAESTGTRTAVVMGVAGCFRERQNPLETFLRQIVDEKSKVKDGKVASSILQHYRELCDALIDKLIDAQEKPDLNIGHCIKAIYHLSAAYPEAVSSSKAAILLPYLRSPTNAEDQANTSFLLKIFTTCVTRMPKTASNFARTLESKLLPMVNKASGGAAGLQESIACLCAVVNNLTQSYERLVKLLGSCVGKLEHVRKNFEKTGHLPAEQKTIALLLCITGLLGEHCDFDDVSSTNGAMSIEIQQITKDYVSDYIFDLLCAFREMPAIPAVRKAALQSMGFLFRSYPTLMMHETSLKIMDDVLESDDVDTQAVLLVIIQDFLIAESLKSVSTDKKAAAEIELNKGKVNMTELIGDTDNYAESNVSTSIVQRYLLRILDAALHPQTQTIAVEILTFTVKQGLAHPIQSAPIMIALETSADPSVVSRAFQIHSILHHKHGSIINTRFSETARVAFDYQSKTAEGGGKAVRGFRQTIVNTSVEPVPVACLHLWYGLIREKRPLKRDFLKILVRAFDVDAADLSTRATITRNDVDFARFLADNLATFDYKTQEEVLVVIDRLTAVIAVSGSHLFDILSSWSIEGGEEERDKKIEGETLVIRVGAVMRRAMAEDEDEDDEEDGDDEDKEIKSAVPMADDPSLLSPSKRNLPKPQSFPAPLLLHTTHILSLALLLRAHLQSLYSLPDAKCRKFSFAAKKSAMGDRAAVRRDGVAVAFGVEGVPGLVRGGVESLGELEKVKEVFIGLVEGMGEIEGLGGGAGGKGDEDD